MEDDARQSPESLEIHLSEASKELAEKEKDLKKARLIIDQYADQARTMQELLQLAMREKKNNDYESKMYARNLFLEITKNYKPFTGGKDDHFLTWWNGILEVFRFMGDFTTVLTGDVLFHLLGEDVRATIGARIDGFGTLDIGAVEQLLQDIFIRSGEDRYDKLLEI
jgi:hypothetical protein